MASSAQTPISPGLSHPDPEDREFRLRRDDFTYLAHAVRSRTGIVIGANKRDMVYARLAKRLRRLGLSDFRDYVALLESPAGDQEIGALVNALTTNLTHFYREKHHFDHLQHTALPLALSKARHISGKPRLRIWSAGCSSGMEPYSIAMVLSLFDTGLNGWDIRILATDIDTDVLDQGRSGIYRESDADDIPAAMRKRFVIPIKDARGPQVRMSDTLKQRIAFKPLNLMEPWPMRGPFDMIFCRNVVIYFDKQTQARLFDRYAEILRPGGFLYIGHSESLFNVTDRFRLVGRTIYQKER